MQALEAMLFALAAAGPPAPGVRLGALVFDDCDTDTRGLEMALDFIKGNSRSFTFTYILLGYYLCCSKKKIEFKQKHALWLL